jgi:hypothetical protein
MMADLRFPEILDTIRSTRGAYYKLTILAGPARSGKTKLLRQIADAIGIPLINFNLLLSQRLLSHSRRQRSLNAEAIAIDIIDEHMKDGLCLDNTELLFDKTLKTNPLVFLQDVSRNRLIVATWNGIVADGELRYGHNGHPDYFSHAVKGFPVISVAEDKLQIHLTT